MKAIVAGFLILAAAPGLAWGLDNPDGPVGSVVLTVLAHGGLGSTEVLMTTGRLEDYSSDWSAGFTLQAEIPASNRWTFIAKCVSLRVQADAEGNGLTLVKSDGRTYTVGFKVVIGGR